MIKTKHIKTGLIYALVMCFLQFNSVSFAAEVLIKKIGFNQQDQLEISISKKTNFKIFTLENPHRLVVDLTAANLEQADEKPILSDFVSSWRSKKDANFFRFVFDLDQKITIQKVRFEKVKNQNSGKIIAQIIRSKPANTSTQSETEKFISSKLEEFEIETKKINNPDGSAKYVVRKIPKKLPIIVIDAGHGGKDPGTIGNFARSREKNITLSYAKELKKQLINSKRYRAYLTRDDDYFIPLRQRVAKARKMKADLFISLHANSISDKFVNGFSIYTLSEKSSDKQAELLAQKENQSDIIAGVNFSGASEDIMKTLIDLSQRDSNNSSSRFANIVIKLVKDSGIEILQNTHRFAGFAVLTAPDMASTLIELGYLSNKNEEKQLNSISYKRKITSVLVAAIDQYFTK